jgi:hypothetical protein
LQIKTKIVSCHTADFKPVKQEVNSTVILPPLVFSVFNLDFSLTEWSTNGTGCFKKCKQLFEYQHLLLLRDIWWSKF